MTTTIQCPRCQEMSTDTQDCSECGAPIGGMQASGENGVHIDPQFRFVSKHGYASQSSGGAGRGLNLASGDKPAVPQQPMSETKKAALFQIDPALLSSQVIELADPTAGLLSNARVPDHKCICPNPNCGIKVSPDNTRCHSCGTEYSFRPNLRAGDIVANQYEVKGPMAFGGLGWIYLAQDLHVNDRWVVLKGLLNSKDKTSAAAAVMEREFLASVRHEKIVGIYNFVAHQGESYIVMEYIHGKTLKEIRKEKGPMAPVDAISYILKILPAFDYLHQKGMVYCDFSPDNMMTDGKNVTLIDLGAVRRTGHSDGDVFGKTGFMPAEASYDPSPVADLFTIGRTLASLILEMSMTLTDEIDWQVPLKPFQSLGLLEATHGRWEATLEDGSPLPSWLRFDNANAERRFTGMPPHGMTVIPVMVRSIDKSGHVSLGMDGKPLEIPFDIIPPLALPEPEALKFRIPLAPYVDSERCARTGAQMLRMDNQVSWELTLQDGSPLPAWIQFNPETRELNARVVPGCHEVNIQARATDYNGVSHAEEFAIRLPFIKSESLYRFLRRATAYEPADRFQSAAEMSYELTGVLHELRALEKGVPLQGRRDVHFSDTPLRSILRVLDRGENAQWLGLSTTAIDPDDTAASQLMEGTAEQDIARVINTHPYSIDARLTAVAMGLREGVAAPSAKALLSQAATLDPKDWRPYWYLGLQCMADRAFQDAVACFDRVYDAIPGSALPKLALGLALKCNNIIDPAVGLLERASLAAPERSLSAFNLSKIYESRLNRGDAVKALGQVQPASSAYPLSRIECARLLITTMNTQPIPADFFQAEEELKKAVGIDEFTRNRIGVAICLEAAKGIEEGWLNPKSMHRLMNRPLRPAALRMGAADLITACARQAPTEDQRYEFLALADSIRPVTRF